MKNEIRFWLFSRFVFIWFFFLHSSFYTAIPIWMPSVCGFFSILYFGVESIRKEKACCEKSKLNFYLLLLFFVRFIHLKRKNKTYMKEIRMKRNRVFFSCRVTYTHKYTSICILFASAWSIFFTRPDPDFGCYGLNILCTNFSEFPIFSIMIRNENEEYREKE